MAPLSTRLAAGYHREMRFESVSEKRSPRFPPGRLVPGHTRQDSAGLVRARVGLQRILGLDHERGSKSVKELFQRAER